MTDGSDIYQEYIVELYKNPLNFGRIEHADFQAEVYNPTCGDKIILYLKVNKKTIIDAKHEGKGCAISQASASLVTEYLKGKTIDEAKELAKDEVMTLIKLDLSKNPTRIRCALLPLDALKKAIKNTEVKK